MKFFLVSVVPHDGSDRIDFVDYAESDRKAINGTLRHYVEDMQKPTPKEVFASEVNPNVTHPFLMMDDPRIVRKSKRK